jgi:hypothetical protein
MSFLLVEFRCADHRTVRKGSHWTPICYSSSKPGARRRCDAGHRPPGRTTQIAVRFDRFTPARLKALAALRNTGYQTLPKEFVIERLYEEERRAGIIE